MLHNLPQHHYQLGTKYSTTRAYEGFSYSNHHTTSCCTSELHKLWYVISQHNLKNLWHKYQHSVCPNGASELLPFRLLPFSMFIWIPWCVLGRWQEYDSPAPVHLEPTSLQGQHRSNGYHNYYEMRGVLAAITESTVIKFSLRESLRADVFSLILASKWCVCVCICTCGSECSYVFRWMLRVSA